MLTGLDRLLAEDALARRVRGTKLALLAHPASLTRDLVHAADAMIGLGAKPQIIFGPEHGYGGEAQDLIGVDDAHDRYGIPVKSLYGSKKEDLSPTEEDLADVDLLVIDLQDVGARYYTFVWTAVLAAQAATKLGKRVMILERPNPIGCAPSSLEGRRQLPELCSFVGLHPIPIRHALTLAEIVAWRAAEEKTPLEQIEIVRTADFDRTLHAPAWDRPFVPPSPNMPTYDTALVYPGACLVEGTNLSEGRGTTRPFEMIGAPWIDGAKLAHRFSMLEFAGVRARPVTFKPTFQKHAGQICGGVFVHVTDPLAFRPVAAYLALLALAHEQDREKFVFRTEAYEFVDDIPAIDLLTGDGEARALIATGAPPEEIARAIATVRKGDAEIVRAARDAADALAAR
ncbi:MAG: exo-beta-N-acetylmuramidase NamZ family protein [Polyangiaceae bacterium]